MALDIQTVTDLIERAAREIVLPRFGQLSQADIESKPTVEDPEDVVTVIDHAVEAFLTETLIAVDPSAVVIGEEAAHRNPALLKLMHSDHPLWIIDPIDGTKNLTMGESGFGIMVSYVVEGHARAAWIVLPARDQTYVAEEGSGTFLNGERTRVAVADASTVRRGAVLTRYMPDGLRGAVTTSLNARVEILSPSGCAAIEYTDILRGVRDFVIYYRLLPWDHAAPALILSEGGGSVIHADGRPYTARSGDQIAIVSRNRKIAAEIRHVLEPLATARDG